MNYNWDTYQRYHPKEKRRKKTQIKFLVNCIKRAVIKGMLILSLILRMGNNSKIVAKSDVIIMAAILK